MSDVIVTTTQGTLRGYRLESGIEVFKGCAVMRPGATAHIQIDMSQRGRP